MLEAERPRDVAGDRARRLPASSAVTRLLATSRSGHELHVGLDQPPMAALELLDQLADGPDQRAGVVGIGGSGSRALGESAHLVDPAQQIAQGLALRNAHALGLGADPGVGRVRRTWIGAGPSQGGMSTARAVGFFLS